MRFDEVWLRILANTSIKKNKELANIVGIAESVVSKRAKENNFPVEWGFFVSQEFGLNTDWLLTGEGEKETEKKDFLAEIQDWLNETSRTNPDIKIWFKVQFENKFPEFLEWKKRKDERKQQHNIAEKSKIA